MIHRALTEEDKEERLYFFVRYKVINAETKMLDYANRLSPIDCELADGAKERYATPKILTEDAAMLRVCIYLGGKVELDQHGDPTVWDGDVLDPCESKLGEEGYRVID